jgi:hypothetical protein
MTADALVYTGSGIPVNVRYLQKGESEYDSVVSSLKCIFNYGEGKAKPNLSGKVQFAADQGYWGKSVLYYLLSLGADVIGTVKRQPWFPFGFGGKQRKSGSGTPLDISAQGPPCLFQKSVKHNLGKKNDKDFIMTATAFRNGHSSTVALAMTTSPAQTTQSSTRMLDDVISTAASARRYLSSSVGRKSMTRFMYGFKFVVGSSGGDGDDRNEGHTCAIADVVFPLTEGQGDRGWRIMRGQACTSSCMDRVISAKAPFIDVNDTELYDDYKFVLEFTYMLHKLPRAVALDNANNNDVDTSDEEEEIGQEVVDILWCCVWNVLIWMITMIMNYLPTN